jgi:type I restriction enzyme S subunit
MKSNYKQLGNYIQAVNIRNKDLKIDTLLGVSISKVLIPSIANTIGTNMKTYKIIRRNQFAYGPVTSRNGDKISIALLGEHEEAIVSQAYTVFEVIDVNELHPEYLMMWFRRPEFDRYARFKSHGSAREVFDWDELCEVELPIPSIEKQREIVKEYNTVVNRIILNEQLNQKLEETAQALYKHWFVDFEFPNEKGEPYKSNGGAMVYNEELDKEIPEGWEVLSIKEFCSETKSGGTPSRTKNSFWLNGNIPWLKTGEVKNNIILSTEEFITEEGLKNSSAKLLPINTVLMSMYGANAGEVGFLKTEVSTNQACCGMICHTINDAAFLYYHLLVNQEFNHSQAIGGAQQNLSKEYIENILLAIPSKALSEIGCFKTLIESSENIYRQIKSHIKLNDLLLSKMTKVEHEKVVVN